MSALEKWRDRCRVAIATGTGLPKRSKASRQLSAAGVQCALATSVHAEAAAEMSPLWTAEAWALNRIEACLAKANARPKSFRRFHDQNGLRLALSWLRESIDESLTQKAGEK